MACAGALVASLSGCLEVPTVQGGKVYVTSGFEDRIYVLDARTGTITDTVVVDRRRGEIDEPHGIAVAPTGDHWYATLSHGDPTLWKFETGTDRLVGRVTLPQSGASRIGVSPDGLLGVVPDYFRGEAERSSVTLLGLTGLEVIHTAEPCRAPHDAQFSPDGTKVAIACALGDEVVVVDGATLEVLDRYSTGMGSRPMNLVW
ncbi:MAG: YncE family protein, partial [Longimicrobiales bacterium]